MRIKTEIESQQKQQRLLEKQGYDRRILDKLDEDQLGQLHRTISIAYFNLAVEYEYLLKFDLAIENYLKCKYFLQKQESREERSLFIERVEKNIESVYARS